MGAFSRGSSSLAKTESVTALVLRVYIQVPPEPLILSVAPYQSLTLLQKLGISERIRLSSSVSICVNMCVNVRESQTVCDRLTCACCCFPTQTPAASSLPPFSPNVFFFSPQSSPGFHLFLSPHSTCRSLHLDQSLFI